MQLYEFTLREDYYREDPGADSPRPVFGQVEGTDRDIGSNAILYYHALGDGEPNKTTVWSHDFHALIQIQVAQISAIQTLHVPTSSVLIS